MWAWLSRPQTDHPIELQSSTFNNQIMIIKARHWYPLTYMTTATTKLGSIFSCLVGLSCVSCPIALGYNKLGHEDARCDITDISHGVYEMRRRLCALKTGTGDEI
jgi:hypothetical protein